MGSMTFGLTRAKLLIILIIIDVARRARSLLGRGIRAKPLISFGAWVVGLYEIEENEIRLKAYYKTTFFAPQEICLKKIKKYLRVPLFRNLCYATVNYSGNLRYLFKKLCSNIRSKMLKIR